MQGTIGVDVVGNIIVVRLRGTPSDAMVVACQEQVLAVLRKTPHRKILYDVLELETPSVELSLAQQRVVHELHGMVVRIAIVVPDTRLAFQARLAFGEGEHRVFYNDLAGAQRWLDEGSAN